ncbi:MAG: homoserine O-succinyltransferase [Chitinivibrionales bacterium]
MTVVLPQDYHAKAALEKRKILCKTQQQALREDIRALRIGILNIMPKAETYEFNLLHPLGRSILQIEPVWIRLKTHIYKSTSHEHLDSLYIPFQEAIDRQSLDGLIITGAPVEERPFEQITYWQEILRILRYARKNIASTLGICWGGLALAKFLGIEKTDYSGKLFGIFETRNLDPNHRITGGMDDIFWCPQSRHSGISDEDLEKARDEGTINLLAHSKHAGYTIFESTDQRFLMHLGHPEYNSRRLVEEYQRDIKRGRTDVPPPANFDVENPVNRWRGHRTEFFSQWIKYLHETTTY